MFTPPTNQHTDAPYDAGDAAPATAAPGDPVGYEIIANRLHRDHRGALQTGDMVATVVSTRPTLADAVTELLHAIGADVPADAAFIAAARTDVPALAAELEQARREAARLQADLDYSVSTHRQTRQQAARDNAHNQRTINTLEQELFRVRDELEQTRADLERTRADRDDLAATLEIRTAERDEARRHRDSLGTFVGKYLTSPGWPSPEDDAEPAGTDGE